MVSSKGRVSLVLDPGRCYVLVPSWEEFKDFSPQEINMDTTFCGF